jgi:two-component system response regulator QseB
VLPLATLLAGARIELRALLRRSFNRPQPVLEYRGISLDSVSQVVSFQGLAVNLQRKEFFLLHELLAQPGRVLKALYGWDEEVESNALEVHVHHLRKKFFPELIRTVRGVGYLVDKA